MGSAWRITPATFAAISASACSKSPMGRAPATSAKYWWPDTRLMFMAEGDGVRQTFSAAPAFPRWQLVAYGGPTWMAARGLSVGVAYELFAEDLQVRGLQRQALDAWAAFLPWAHFEIMLSGRAQWIG